MVAQAQAMMKDPNFQAKMKQVSQGKAFKDSMKKTKEVLKDPKKAKEVTKTMEKKVEEGNKQLEEAEKKEKAEQASKKNDETTEASGGAKDESVKELSETVEKLDMKSTSEN